MEYEEFALWAHITLGLEDGLAHWTRQSGVTPSDVDAIKREITERIKRYDNAGLSCFKDVFLRFMGVV